MLDYIFASAIFYIHVHINSHISHTHKPV